MKYDLLIRGGNVYCGGAYIRKGLDIAVRDGMILDAQYGMDPADAAVSINAAGCLVTPSFTDTHMHIDKSFTAMDDDTTTLESARDRSNERQELECASMTDEELYQDILKRSSRVLDMCLRNGTTCVKTNVRFGPPVGTVALEAMLQLKEDYRGKVDLLTVVPCYPGTEKEWRAYAEKGAIDVVGGYPNCGTDPVTGKSFDDPVGYKEAVDKAFALALEYDLPIDLHCNESNNPDISCFRYILMKTMEHQLQRRVCVGHVTALSAAGQSRDTVLAAAALAAKARVNVETLTSCNLYLMDWGRRGPTAVEALLDNGVNVSLASDNIRDCFRPFGDADLIREAQLTAQIHKFVTKADMGRLFEMITFNAAENALRTDYGVITGCHADLVILDAPDLVRTIVEQPKKRYVIRDGKILVRDGRLV